MQQVFTDSGFRLTTTRDAETITVRFPIEPESNYRISRNAHLARIKDRSRVPDDAERATSTETEVASDAEAQFTSLGTNR
jgi:hypothetical protein